MHKVFDKNVFAKRLQQLMQENNDTIYSIAEYLHLSPSTISRYTNAEMAPKATAIEKLSSKYGVNPVWLMGGNVEKYLTKEENRFKQIPVLGTIAAGQPILAQEYIEGYECVPENMNADFCLRVKGDSMINARIYDGNIVYIRQQPDVENGEIAAVIIDGENATLKRVYKYPGMIVLRPENPNYQEKTFTKKDFKDVKIIGKAIFFRSEVI